MEIPNQDKYIQKQNYDSPNLEATAPEKSLDKVLSLFAVDKASPLNDIKMDQWKNIPLCLQ